MELDDECEISVNKVKETSKFKLTTFGKKASKDTQNKVVDDKEIYAVKIITVPDEEKKEICFQEFSIL